jgi:hypothetical protein
MAIIKTVISYNSKFRFLTEQPSETNEFLVRHDALKYLKERLDDADKNVVYVYFYNVSESSILHACISESPHFVISFLNYGLTNATVCLNIFEFFTYKEALSFLDQYFKRSPIH